MSRLRPERSALASAMEPLAAHAGAALKLLRDARAPQVDFEKQIRALIELQRAIDERKPIAALSCSGPACPDGIIKFLGAVEPPSLPGLRIATAGEAPEEPRRPVLVAPDGSEVPLPSEVVIGRPGGGATLPVEGGQVSRKHACLRPVQGGLVLEDLGSTNGTWVDGRKLQPHSPETLRADSEIGLGGLPGEQGAASFRVSWRAAGRAQQDRDLDVLWLDGSEVPPHLMPSLLGQADVPLLVMRPPGLPAPTVSKSDRVKVLEWSEETADQASKQVEKWLDAVAPSIARRAAQGLANQLAGILDSADSALKAARKQVAEDIEREKLNVRQLKDAADKLKRELDACLREASEHQSRMKGDVGEAGDEQLKEFLEGTLHSRMVKAVDASNPSLRGGTSVNAGVVHAESVEAVKRRIHEALGKETLKWADEAWERMVRRRRQHVSELRRAASRIDGVGQDWIPDLRVSDVEVSTEVKAIVSRRVKMPAADSLEHTSPLVAVLKGTMGLLTGASMLIFVAGRWFLEGSGAQLRTQLPKYAAVTACLVGVAAVVMFVRHYHAQAAKVRAALRKDFETILEDWVESIVRVFERNLEWHAREVKAALEGRVDRRVDELCADLADQQSAANSRVSDANSRIRQLESLSEALNALKGSLKLI